MSFSYLFGPGTQWSTAWLDANFTAAGLLGTLPCTATGTNTLVVTPFSSPSIAAPTFALQSQVRVSFIVAHTNSGAVTAQVGSAAPLNVYKDTASGPAVLSGSELIANNYAILSYDPALNSGAGGYHLQTAPSSANGTVTSVATGSGLTGGTITTTGTLSLATIANLRLFANISGGTAVPSAQTLTAILDAIVSSTQGAILNRGASTWAASVETAYTPALTFGGGSTGITYSTQVGESFSIGYLTFAMANLVLTSKGSSTGTATVSLPSAAGGGNRIGGGLITSYSNLSSATTTPWVRIAASGSVATLVLAGAGVPVVMDDSNFQNTSTLQIIMLYLTG